VAKRAKNPTLDQLRHLARVGAEATITRLRTEILAIERAFPELASARGRKHTLDVAAKKTYHMSSAARKAVSDRMTKYWAARRKAKAKLSKKG
jgi:hypothetical protein